MSSGKKMRPIDPAPPAGGIPPWGAAALARIDALVTSEGAPRRALITGPAGSGKTPLLRRARTRLLEAGVSSTVLRPTTTHADVDAGALLLIDDAHRLDEGLLSAVVERLRDPGAQVIAAVRPWPRSAAMRELADALEHAHPAIVLGHLSMHDLADVPTVSKACARAILTATAGATWLVAEVLLSHRADCDEAGSGHRRLADDLQDAVAHRLAGIDAATSEAIVAASLSPSTAANVADELLSAGYSEGMLQRNGRPIPVIGEVVRATVPLARMVDFYIASASASTVVDSPGVEDIGGDRIAAMLLRRGQQTLATDPAAAVELLHRAGRAGADPASVAVHLALAAWAAGGIDAAAALLDGVMVRRDHPDHDRAADLSAAIWAARGDLDSAVVVYRASGPLGPESSARAVVAALGAGDRRALESDRAHGVALTMPSTLSVSLDLLSRGVAVTVSGAAQHALADLVRASEVYTASGNAAPIVELPAVIAALVAMSIGELDTAHSVIADALSRGHGGAWARPRLLLWHSWVALQREHRAESESSLTLALAGQHPLASRDATLASALSVAIARRYGDLGELTAHWRHAWANVLRTQFDVFSILPLGELVLAAVRVGDEARMDPYFEQTLERVARLGKGNLWEVPLHWTGIQRGILRGQPDDLRPHARALLDVVATNPLAARMAQAGRVWTAVLAGKVDPDVVEAAALGLAGVGLAWDGARLAGHAAGRTDDKRAISRLLSCARHLHPREEVRPPASTDSASDVTSGTQPAPGATLSPRERDVAELVVQGKTYVEIGESIFISPRTAEHHIARIRRRLGATTRSDLIAKLRAVLAGEDETPGR